MRALLGEAIDSVLWFRRQIAAQFAEHRLTTNASALTYTTLFAVVPLMTVAYAILSLLPEFAAVGERVQAYVFQNFVPASSSLIRDKLVEYSHQARQLSVVGLGFLVVTAFLMLVNVEQAFNAIWDVREHRRGLQRFLVYWGVLTCGPLLVVGGMLISSYLFSLPFVAGMDTFGARQKLLGFLPAVLSTAGFTVLYSAVPNCVVRFGHAFVGGLFSMLVFEAAKSAFTWAMAFSDVHFIYGTFAAVPLFLVWVYLFWVLVLSGAILVRTLSLPRDPVGARQEPPLVLCIRVLGALHDGYRAGRAVAEAELARAVPMRLADHERVFKVLRDMDLVAQAEGGLVLSRDLRCVMLRDLYRRLPENVEAGSLERIEGLDRALAPLLAFVRERDATLDVALDGLLA